MSDPRVPSSFCAPISPEPGDQYREYLIPACNVSEEQELLREYAQERFSDVLRGIYTDFYVLITLMHGYARQNDKEDSTYFLLAEKLQQPLDKLNRACSATADWELISRRIVAAEA